jgi:hypothetical protein
MLRDYDYGWIAGIIDGEGCLGSYTNGKGRIGQRSLLQVGNTDLRILEHLKLLCGGIIFECTRTDRPKSKRIWTWRLYGGSLFKLLETIQPFLISKRDKADEILKIQANR